MLIQTIRKFSFSLFFLLCCMTVYADQAHSQAIVNSLKYIRGLDSKQVDFLVVYDPAQPASQKEATDIAKSFRAINAVGTVTVKEVGNIAGYKGSGVLYVTQNLDAHFATIQSFAKKQKLLPVSTHMSCVKSQCCALSYLQSKRLNIYLNQTNLRDLGFDVDATFNFMVKKV